MSENRPINELAVDRRDETVATQQSGYASTEQVTHDIAAERRLRFAKATQIIYVLLGILEILLGMRFVLKLIAANAESGFAIFIYGITKLFIAPFALLVGTPTAGGSSLEVTTLIGMAVYALFVWIIVRVIMVAADRPSARTVTRSVHEQTPSSMPTQPTNLGGTGTERTTHSIQK